MLRYQSWKVAWTFFATCLLLLSLQLVLHLAHFRGGLIVQILHRSSQLSILLRLLALQILHLASQLIPALSALLQLLL